MNTTIEIRKTFTYQNYVNYHAKKVGSAYKTDILIRPLQSSYSSPLFESVEAAKKISVSAGGEVDLLVDSAPTDFCLFEAFVLAKVPIHVHLLNDDNDVISKWSRACKQAGIDMTLHKVMSEEWDEVAAELKSQYNCALPRQLRLLALLKLVGGRCPVLSGSLPVLKNSDGKWDYTFPSDDHLLFLQAFFNQDLEFGVPSFFVWSPELLHSFAKLPLLLNTLHLGDALPPDLERRMLTQAGFSLHNARPSEETEREIQFGRKVATRRDFLIGATAAATLLLSNQVMAARSVAFGDLRLDPSSLKGTTVYSDMILIAADKHDK